MSLNSANALNDIIIHLKLTIFQRLENYLPYFILISKIKSCSVNNTLLLHKQRRVSSTQRGCGNGHPFV
jgi:hypothetical protein